MTPHGKGIRAAMLGVLVNLGLAVLKIGAGVLGNSYALIADGIESTADILSSFVVMGGMHISSLPPDDEHPYGHGKAEPLAGVVVSTLLLLAAAWIALGSVREILTPHHAPAWFTLPVLALVVAAKELLSRYVLKVGEDLGSTAVRGDAWHHRSDALTSAAAFLGIVIALVGGEGFEPADDWAALVACAVITFNGVRLLRESVNDLMDSSVDPSLVDRIRRISSEVEGVVAIEKCRVRRIGLELSMDIHVTVDGSASVRRGHEIAHAVKDRLKASNSRIADVLVHVEPDDLLKRP
jgi:cation diffusion facilitator family transporter